MLLSCQWFTVLPVTCSTVTEEAWVTAISPQQRRVAMDPFSQLIFVISVTSFLIFQWLFHKGSPWVSKRISPGFLSLSDKQKVEWNSRWPTRALTMSLSRSVQTSPKRAFCANAAELRPSFDWFGHSCLKLSQSKAERWSWCLIRLQKHTQRQSAHMFSVTLLPDSPVDWTGFVWFLLLEKAPVFERKLFVSSSNYWTNQCCTTRFGRRISVVFNYFIICTWKCMFNLIHADGQTNLEFLNIPFQDSLPFRRPKKSAYNVSVSSVFTM